VNIMLTKKIEHYYTELMQSEGKVVSYGISDNYVPNWNEQQALTEYVANSYDENKTDFTINTVDDWIVLEDQSTRGIKLEDLVVGNSSSREFTYKIGTHGEGLKLGALVLVRNNKKVIIETIGHTIIFFLEFDEKLNSNILKSKIITNDRTVGSKIFLETNCLDDVKKRFLFLNDELNKVNDFLYKAPESTSNHIYVNTLSSQEIRSDFSYSIFKKQIVNRDRNMLENPYEEILLTLLSMNDKEAIKMWLKSLCVKHIRPFELELVKHLMTNYQRKLFKEQDYSLFKEAAKELDMLYLDDNLEAKVHAFRVANKDKHIVNVPYTYYMYSFCRSVLELPMSAKSLNFGYKENGKHFVPILNNFQRNMGVQDLLIELVKDLSKAKVLKSASIEENKVVFVLDKKTNEKMDYIHGRTSKANTSIREVFNVLYNLSEYDTVGLENFPFEKHSDGIQWLVMDEFPLEFHVRLDDEEMLSSLSQNVQFLPHKEVAKGIAFQLKGANAKTRLLNSSLELTEEITSCFSYTKSYEFEVPAFKNATVVKTFLQAMKENLMRDDLYELSMIDTISYKLNHGSYNYTYDSNKKELKHTLEKQFSSLFGSQTVISTSEDDDNRAIYNGYKVITVNKRLSNYFKALDVKLSSHIQSVTGGEFDVVEKPTFETFKQVQDSPYKPAFNAAYTLYQSLLYLYNETADAPYEENREFLKSLLPYYHKENDLRKGNSNVNLTNTNIQKVTREYCFEIFQRTFYFKNFQHETIQANGFNRKGFIFMNNPFKLGTFLHEYIHFSTDLVDIDECFEEALSLISLLAHGFANPDEKEVSKFFNEYKKWLGA